MHIDDDTRTVTGPQASKRLSRLRFILLRHLIANRAKWLTAGQLVHVLWPSFPPKEPENVIRNHVCLLRKTLIELGFSDMAIITCCGGGIRLYA